MSQNETCFAKKRDRRRRKSYIGQKMKHAGSETILSPIGTSIFIWVGYAATFSSDTKYKSSVVRTPSGFLIFFIRRSHFRLFPASYFNIWKLLRWGFIRSIAWWCGCFSLCVLLCSRLMSDLLDLSVWPSVNLLEKAKLAFNYASLLCLMYGREY